jgi:hypothetical protein
MGISSMGINPLIYCEICDKPTVKGKFKFMTFEMCPDCYKREQQYQADLAKLAEVRVSISNELADLRIPRGEKNMAVNEKFVDEHVAFWNEENKLIQNMTLAELEERINKWEAIYREAKTKLSADRELKRNRIASLSKEERDKLLSPNSNPADSRLVTDSIQSVKRRQKRMNTAEKVAESMRNLYTMARMSAEQIEAAIKSNFAEIHVSGDKPSQRLQDKRPIAQVSFSKNCEASASETEAQTNTPALSESKDSQKESIAEKPTETDNRAKPWFDSSSIQFAEKSKE